MIFKDCTVSEIREILRDEKDKIENYNKLIAAGDVIDHSKLVPGDLIQIGKIVYDDEPYIQCHRDYDNQVFLGLVNVPEKNLYIRLLCFDVELSRIVYYPLPFFGATKIVCKYDIVTSV